MTTPTPSRTAELIAQVERFGGRNDTPLAVVSPGARARSCGTSTDGVTWPPSRWSWTRSCPRGPSAPGGPGAGAPARRLAASPAVAEVRGKRLMIAVEYHRVGARRVAETLAREKALEEAAECKTPILARG